MPIPGTVIAVYLQDCCEEEGLVGATSAIIGEFVLNLNSH